MRKRILSGLLNFYAAYIMRARN